MTCVYRRREWSMQGAMLWGVLLMVGMSGLVNTYHSTCMPSLRSVSMCGNGVCAT